MGTGRTAPAARLNGVAAVEGMAEADDRPKEGVTWQSMARRKQGLRLGGLGRWSSWNRFWKGSEATKRRSHGATERRRGWGGRPEAALELGALHEKLERWEFSFGGGIWAGDRRAGERPGGDAPGGLALRALLGVNWQTRLIVAVVIDGLTPLHAQALADVAGVGLVGRDRMIVFSVGLDGIW